MRITIHATIEDASSAPQLVQIGEVTRDAGVDPASGLGLFVREANALLRQIQSVVLNEQADEFIRVAAACQACGTRFTGIKQPGEFRIVTRSHVIAWRDDLVQRALSIMTIRHRLAALSSLFEHLCESNAVTHNPVKGVKRPPVESYEGKTPALGDHQARALLEAPDGVSLKGKRDRAILATLLYHALRREELCKLTVKDFRHERRGVLHLKVSGKGSKTRYVPLHPATSGLILDYLEADGRALETTGALFRAVGNRAGGAGQGHHRRRDLQDRAGVLSQVGV